MNKPQSKSTWRIVVTKEGENDFFSASTAGAIADLLKLKNPSLSFEVFEVMDPR